jgi:membrane-associated protease RseP (regulator of RpoE activity)
MPNDTPIMDDQTLPEPKRHVALPIVLFLATCLSTFWTGAVDWKPLAHLSHLKQGAKAFVANLPQGKPLAAIEQGTAVAGLNVRQGLGYMGLVLALLLAHEMGHFLMALRHRVPASLPYFIPLPVVPFGTLGAVIGMEGSRADRRELFDLGLAGPLAGLIVTLPVTWIGIRLLQPVAPVPGDICFHNPLLIQYMIAWLRPDYPTPAVLYLNQFNTSWLMAGWVGMLVTGLNMLPVSQLDGGHVSYALFGRGANWLARGLLLAAILYIVYIEQYEWSLLLLLVIVLGIDHPVTVADRRPFGLFRTAIGWASLLIPILCFPLRGIGVH